MFLVWSNRPSNGDVANMTLSSDFILKWLVITGLYTVATYLIAWMLSGIVSAVTAGWQGGGRPEGSWPVMYALCLPAGLVTLVIGSHGGWWILVGVLAGILALYVVQLLGTRVFSRRK